MQNGKRELKFLCLKVRGMLPLTKQKGRGVLHFWLPKNLLKQMQLPKEFHLYLSLMEEGGIEAAGLKVAEPYVMAFGNITKQSTTLLLPNDATGLSSQISQAMLLYKRLGGKPTTGSTGGFEAVTPSEKSQNATKVIEDATVSEEKASKFSLQNRPGFSLQNNK